VRGYQVVRILLRLFVLVSKKLKSQPISSATSGLSTSVVFTSVQGLEFSNPQSAYEKDKRSVSSSSKYFGTHLAFSKTIK
jgi:hypothetical protein